MTFLSKALEVVGALCIARWVVYGAVYIFEWTRWWKP